MHNWKTLLKDDGVCNLDKNEHGADIETVTS
jgi:hypothetical protein